MNMDQIDEVMMRYVENEEMPGGELFIHQNDQEIYHGMWGYSNLETKTPVSDDTVYCMCSMSKVLTAVGFLKLVEQGKAGLDDEVKNIYRLLPISG